MKHWMFAFVFMVLGTTSSWSGGNAVFDEALYFNYQKQILSSEKSLNHNFSAISPYEQKIFVNAIEDMVEEKNPQALQVLESLEPVTFDLTEQLRVALIKLRAGKAKNLPKDLASAVENTLRAGNVEMRIIYLIAAHENYLTKRHSDLVMLAKAYPEYTELNPQVRVTKSTSLRDLYYRSPDLNTVLDGKYAGGVKIFLFCRTNRLYPCLMLMRDARGDAVRKADGSLWFHKALASSKYGLPSYTRNGNTPTGVMTLDSVMPSADQQISFGKFRRIILNFIDASEGEQTLLSLLPDSSRSEDWWKPSTVSRDIGRADLRIHGTGKKNEDQNSSYFPFVQTSGCIAQRENTYGDVTYTDQRQLLDTIMEQMQLPAAYANETKIKGVLYITEIDSLNAAVELGDLYDRGIQ